MVRENDVSRCAWPGERADRRDGLLVQRLVRERKHEDEASGPKLARQHLEAGVLSAPGAVHVIRYGGI
jgi:hypothetical protein